MAVKRPTTHLTYHLHSDYSLLDSCTDFHEYVDLVKEAGGTAIASTEHGLPRGWVSKKLYCDEVGLKFIHGVEIYLTEQLEPKVRDNYHTVLLAKNEAGIRELNKLVTLSSNKDHSYYTNRISFEELLGISDNIIKTSACLASPLNKLSMDNPWYEKLLRHYNYLEVQPHSHPDQIAFNKRLAKLSKEYGIPLVAGTDTHSSSKYKAECRGILLAAKRQSYGDEDAFDLSYKTTDELLDMFAAQGALSEDEYFAAVENTNVIADACENFTLDNSIKYPILYGSQEEDEKIFETRAWESLDEKLNSGVIPHSQEEAFRSAIEEELRVFKKLKMSGFMLSMSDLIRWCRENGMAIGTARGSVGGSRAAYVTDIIDLNPETWHTVFSRFCNEDREEIGDIDVDVVYDDRPRIFEYITNRFGTDKTARVAAYGTLADKSVIDEVCRALANVVDKDVYSVGNAKVIKNMFAENPGAARKKYPKVFYYYDGLVGTRISQSVHPAGMVISPITLNDNYGTFSKDGETCLLMDMDEAHEVGAAKYDFLALKTVKVIRDTCNYIGIPYPSTHMVDWEDEAVWADMCNDQTAIFQFESSFAADCFKRFRPVNIFDMSLVTACIRPSGASYRDQLLARKQHHNPSEIIDELLSDNLGYLIYQEDTIKFLQLICGLSGSEADNVRRAIGRKQKDRLDAALPSILEGYCAKASKERAIAEGEAREFLQIIGDSADYQFGYNHSIAYCLLGYLCGYFRYYYPMEFITAFLNNSQNEDDIASGTALMKLYDVKVSNPKWGVSRGGFFFDKENKVIYKGMSSIKYVGEAVSNELFELSKANDVSDWDVARFFPSLTKPQVFAPLYSDDFWRTVKPIDGAADVLQQLIADGHTVYIVTSSFYETLSVKMTEVLFKYFPFFKWDDVIITRHKQLVRGDVLVDDGVHNLEDGDYLKILMDAPHNRAYDAAGGGMHRVTDWGEVYELVTQYAVLSDLSGEEEVHSQMNVILYSTGCPRCKVLKQKLDGKDISYKVNDSVNEMLALGITQAPILSVEGELLSFTKAIEWVNQNPMKGA